MLYLLLLCANDSSFMGLLCVSYSFDSILIRFFFSFIYFVAGSDWPLYIGLAVVGAICVALGAGLARGARKGRRLPPYSIARTGKRLFTTFQSTSNLNARLFCVH